MTDASRSGAALGARVAERFANEFGHPPSAMASAPGRVNLIGEHTDYNGGEVLPIGIPQRTFVAVGAIDRDRSVAVSLNEPSTGSFDAAAPRRAGEWWDYVAGIAQAFVRAVAPVPAALGAVVGSDVPMGAGLSSSAAIEVATLAALAGLSGRDLPLDRMAILAHEAENGFVGVASGIMDQYASALSRNAHALHVWCDTGLFEHVPMQDAVLVFDTARPRALRDSAYNERRAECDAALERLRALDPALPNLAAASVDLIQSAALPEPLGRRARHVATETARVKAAVRQLSDSASIDGSLLIASHESLRDDFECSTPELDWFVTRAVREPGVRGARLTGAGWGGCAIAVGAADALAVAAPPIAREFAARFSRTARYWLMEASPGVSREPVS